MTLAATAPHTAHLDTAKSILLEPYGLTVRSVEGVFGVLFANRVDYADLYFQYARSESWSLEEGIVKSGSFDIEQGVGVRACFGEKTAFAYSDDISRPALDAAARATRAIASRGSTRLIPMMTGAAYAPLYTAADPIASLEDAAKVALLERIERLARAEDPRVVQVMASLNGTWDVILVARADGHMAADVRPLVRLSVSVIMEQDGLREQGSAGGGGRFD